MKKLNSLSEPMKIAYITGGATVVAAIIGALIGGIFLLRSTAPVQPRPTTPPHATSTLPTGVTSAVTSTPLYVNGLSSTNLTIFVNAFADALQAQDVASIEPHADTLHFFIYCDAGKGFQGTCDDTWLEFKQHIASDKVEFSIPHDTTLGSPPRITCPDLAPPDHAMVIAGTYDNKATILPLPHYGKAFFFFACVFCGSESTWGWEGVFLC